MHAKPHKPYLRNDGEKQKCRESFVAAVRKTGGAPLRIGTLPAEKALCAQLIAASFPGVSILGVEKCDEVFRKIPSVPGMALVRQDVQDWVAGETLLTASYPSRLDMHFDAFNFDLCCAPSASMLNTISQFVANDRIVHVGKPTTLAFTFCRNIRNAAQLKGLRALITSKLQTDPEEKVSYGVKSVAALLQCRLAEATQWSQLTCLTAHDYRASDSSIGMFFIILQGTKRA
jgi:hypothetical protein